MRASAGVSIAPILFAPTARRARLAQFAETLHVLEGLRAMVRLSRCIIQIPLCRKT